MRRVVGSYGSPYVRKVLVALALKGLDYEIDPIVPFYGDEQFTRLSPQRQVPVLIDGETVVSDSTIVCEYLDEAYGGHRLLPTEPGARARARVIESFADERMGQAFVWTLFNERAIAPAVWGRPTDEGRVERALATDVPAIFAWLETQAPEEAFLFGEVGLADIAVAAVVKNGLFVGWRPDREAFPRAAGWIERTLALPAFRALEPFERIVTRTPIAGHREALRVAGVPVAATTLGRDVPTPSYSEGRG